MLSLNYKKADAALRERFALDETRTEELLRALGHEAVYLSTCNRCELYGVGDPYAALELWRQAANAGAFKEYILTYTGEGAVRHLFRVAAGLDSMAVGEDEILGQLKRAFQFAQNRGFTGFALNTIFKAAITCAKRIKTDTRRRSVSVATLAASVCHDFSGDGGKVLVVGAGGEIGGKVVKNLISYGKFEIFAVTRGLHRPSGGVTGVDYGERYQFADAADIFISATSSPHYTITYETLRRHIGSEKPRLFLDLAVPRDIDGDVARLAQSTLLTIDDFEDVARRNRQIRQDQLSLSEEIISEEMDALRKELAFHDLLPTLHFGGELMKFVYRFRDAASGEEFEAFSAVLRRMEEDEGNHNE